MSKLAIIHTSSATIEPLKALAREMLPGTEVINFVDDSILPQLRDNGGDLEDVKDRLMHYASFAKQAGADVILNACSSIGELVADMRQQVSIPVVRIDEAMAEKAVTQGSVIGVAATLATTLRPTMRLIQDKADAMGQSIELHPQLVDAAYQRLIAGDAAGHDSILIEALTELAGTADTVVLAQASMARVVPSLPETLRDRFLSSPRLGMERVKAVINP